jgi:hypothetical protein
MYALFSSDVAASRQSAADSLQQKRARATKVLAWPQKNAWIAIVFLPKPRDCIEQKETKETKEMRKPLSDNQRSGVSPRKMTL